MTNEIKSIIDRYKNRHSGCQDYRVYEEFKQEIAPLCYGNYMLYEESTGMIIKILKI